MRQALGWVMFWSFMAYAAVIGLSRFSYGLFLPGIKDTFEAGYGLLGAIATANKAGYLIGTLLMPLILARYAMGARFAVIMTAAMSLFMLLSGMASGLLELSFWRLMIGVTSAFASVTIMTETLKRVRADRHGLAAAVTWMGASFGIAVSGLAAPVVIASRDAWRPAWMVMGLFGLIVAVGMLVVWLRREAIDAMNPVGSRRVDFRTLARIVFGARVFLWCALAYLCYGFGLLIYLTFIVSTVMEQGFSPSEVAMLWTGMGTMGMLGGPLWGRAIDRWPSGWLLAVSLAIGALASATVLTDRLVPELVGALAFGFVAFVAPALSINVLLRRHTSERTYGPALSTLIAIYSIGQLSGPLVAGVVVDAWGLEVGTSLGCAALLLGAVCGVVYIRQQRSVLHGTDSGTGGSEQSGVLPIAEDGDAAEGLKKA